LTCNEYPQPVLRCDHPESSGIITYATHGPITRYLTRLA